MSGCEKPPCLRSARFYMVPIHRESVVADGPQCSFELVDVAAAVPLVLRQQLGQMSMEIHVLAHSTKIGSIFDLPSPQFDLVFRSNTTEICPVIRDLFESPPKERDNRQNTRRRWFGDCLFFAMLSHGRHGVQLIPNP